MRVVGRHGDILYDPDYLEPVERKLTLHAARVRWDEATMLGESEQHRACSPWPQPDPDPSRQLRIRGEAVLLGRRVEMTASRPLPIPSGRGRFTRCSASPLTPMMGRHRADPEENRDPGQDINFQNA